MWEADRSRRRVCGLIYLSAGTGADAVRRDRALRRMPEIGGRLGSQNIRFSPIYENGRDAVLRGKLQ